MHESSPVSTPARPLPLTSPARLTSASASSTSSSPVMHPHPRPQPLSQIPDHSPLPRSAAAAAAALVSNHHKRPADPLSRPPGRLHSISSRAAQRVAAGVKNEEEDEEGGGAPVLPDRVTRSRDATHTRIMLAKRLRGAHSSASASTSSLVELDATSSVVTEDRSQHAVVQQLPPRPEHIDVMARRHRRRASESTEFFAAEAAVAVVAQGGKSAGGVKVPVKRVAMRLEDFRLSRALGSGGMATVVRAERVGGGKEVALKAVPKKGLSRRAQHYLAREIAIHRSVQGHPNVVSLYEVFEDASGIYLVLELLKGGDVYAVLKRERAGLAELVALQIMGQVLDALQYIHSMGCAHRDIKPENIMFAERPNNLSGGRIPTVKLIDFGLACARNPSAPEKDRTSSEKCGTVRYAAPEIVTETSYVPERCDIWSVGVVLYSLIAHSNPFTGKTEKEVLLQIQNTELSFDAVFWENVSDDSKKLIRACLSRKPSQRPTAAEALKEVRRIVKVLSADSARTGTSGDEVWGVRPPRWRSGHEPQRSPDLSGFSSNVTGEESSMNGRRYRPKSSREDNGSSPIQSSSDDGKEQPSNFFDSFVRAWFSSSSPDRNALDDSN